MITISELMNKIRWDPNEDPDDYELAYIDRISGKLIMISYNDVERVDEGFMILVRDGDEKRIPLHRIRKVMKKGDVVWKR